MSAAGACCLALGAMADRTKHAEMAHTRSRMLGEGEVSPRKAAGVAAALDVGDKVKQIVVCCVLHFV
jgi:heme O synthase-like polyprenyltransferase